MSTNIAYFSMAIVSVIVGVVIYDDLTDNGEHALAGAIICSVFTFGVCLHFFQSVPTILEGLKKRP
jgi:uncharacterized membrane protein YjfL (UPF0719 family)